MLLKPHIHRWIYLGALALIVVGLPLSKAFLSIGGIALAVNFLMEGQFQSRIKELSRQPVPLLMIAFYLLHVIALLWSYDIERGFWDLRIRLPLLLFAVVIPLSKPLERKEFRALIWLFILAVIGTSFLSTWEFIQVRDDPSFDYRELSLFTSHIRYSLMVCLSYLFLLNIAWNANGNLTMRVVSVVLAIWLSIFLLILQSMTGIVIWLLASYLLLFYSLAYNKQRRFRTMSMTILSLTPLLVGGYILLQVDAFYPDEAPNFQELETHSAGGEAYKHDSVNLMLENGHYIHFYVAWGELAKQWDKRSDRPFWTGKDKIGHPINATVMRYLTSKGLRKDSVGVNSLTEEDVSAIENGIANVRFTYGNPVDNRIYTVIWEVDRMINEKGVQGHSVTQRFVYWKTGWKILSEHAIFGVGTGDAPTAFEEMYDRTGSKLSEKNRLRAHNQFLSIGILLGLVGLVVFILSILSPFLFLRNANSFIYIGFAIILYASMLNEDTLETQVGVTLYAFFHMFLLYGVSSLSGVFSKTSS